MPEFISYDRATDKISTVSQPLGGTWGQMSFKRLCQLLDYGEVKSTEQVVSLVIEGDMVRYQVKAKE